jgi:hypothetical protein
VPAQAGGQHVGQRVALVDRHQLRAQRVVGGVQRQRQPHRRALARHPVDAGNPAHRRDRRVGGGHAQLGQALAGAEHVVEVHERLAHPHEDGVVDRIGTAEVERLVEDLGGRQVAPELHPPGRAERARQRAARLARQAERAPAVAVAHQHRLHRAAVGRLEERLGGLVAGDRLAHVAQRGERHLVGQRGAQLERQVGHLLVRVRATRGPLPHLPGTEGGLAVRGEAIVEERQVHAPKGRRKACRTVEVECRISRASSTLPPR